MVEPASYPLSAIDDLHPPIFVTFHCEGTITNDPNLEHFVFDFKRSDFSVLTDRLLSIDFTSLLSDNDVDNCVSLFYNKIYDLFDSCVPLKRLKSSCRSPPWYTGELRSLKNKKNKLWKVYLRSRDTSSYRDFVECYNRFKALSSSLYQEYLNNVCINLYNDPRTFFKFVNVKKKSDIYPSTMWYDGSSSNNAADIANNFASFFESAFSPNSFEPSVDDFEHIRERPSTSVPIPLISHDALMDSISKLKLDFSSGPDGVPSAFIRSCSAALLTPLLIIFNKSLQTGKFPTLWKSSLIIPTHKKGPKNMITNYRPIAKLSCLPKLFESIIYSQIVEWCKDLISPNQHGFLPGRSTTTNLLEFTSHVISGFQRGMQTDCIYTDFSKAFDKLPHSVILFKLRKLGFPPLLLDWMRSYLIDRTYRVSFHSFTSRSISASSGVPQGSHLGPLLFTLAIDDIVPLIVSSKILIYADDMKIFSPVGGSEDSARIQDDLDTFYGWCVSNGLQLNLDKCEIMSFSRGRNQHTFEYTLAGSRVRRVPTVSDLGVKLDARLDFALHTNFIVSRSMSVLGFVKRWSREFSDLQTLIHLYCSLVRPILEYASQVWSPYYAVHSGRIESVQRSLVRFALRELPWDDPLRLPPYADRLRLIGLSSLEKRRRVADLTFMHQLLNSRIDSRALADRVSYRHTHHDLRRPPLLHVCHSRTNYGMHEPINRMCRAVNACPDFNLAITKDTLKRRLFLVFP